jgi:hypothetical protein
MKLNKTYQVIWRDIYVVNNAVIQDILNDLGKAFIHTSYGKLVYKDKTYIILLQNNCGEKSDFIIIPIATIKQYRVLR